MSLHLCTSSCVSALSSAPLLKFARPSGKQIVVVTGAMCQVGGAVLAACICGKWPILRRRRLPHFAALPKNRRALAQVARWQSARVFRGKTCEFDHVRAARNVVTSAFPVSHLMLNQGEKRNWHAKLIIKRLYQAMRKTKRELRRKSCC